jgi:hypothetical protein
LLTSCLAKKISKKGAGNLILSFRTIVASASVPGFLISKAFYASLLTAPNHNHMLTTSRQYFRILTILHLSMCAGTILFLIVMAAMRFLGAAGEGDPALNHLLMPIAVVVVAVGCLGSHFLYKLRLKSVRNLTGLGAKLAVYRSLMIVRWALLEGPALFTVVCYFLTGNQLLLAFAALPVLMLLVSRPSREHATADLGLTWDEKAILDDLEGNIEGLAK